MKKEPWVEKPEWAALREQGRLVIAHQHVCTEACTPTTCSTKFDEWRKKINEAGPDH